MKIIKIENMCLSNLCIDGYDIDVRFTNKIDDSKTYSDDEISVYVSILSIIFSDVFTIKTETVD